MFGPDSVVMTTNTETSQRQPLDRHIETLKPEPNRKSTFERRPQLQIIRYEDEGDTLVILQRKQQITEDQAQRGDGFKFFCIRVETERQGGTGGERGGGAVLLKPKLSVFYSSVSAVCCPSLSLLSVVNRREPAP